MNHQLLGSLEEVLQRYFEEETGLPTVAYVAEALHVSPDYLSSMLKTLTGLNTQQHIHQKLIDKAKEQLSTTKLSVSEIAYQRGLNIRNRSANYLKQKRTFRRWSSESLSNNPIQLYPQLFTPGAGSRHD